MRFVGHSGARVTLRRQGGGAVVRKMAGTPERNERLQKQCEKQTRFSKAGVACPKVLSTGYENGEFWFDMEFVPGMSIAHQHVTGQPVNHGGLTKALLTWLEQFAQSRFGTIPVDTFHNKINQIIIRCNSQPNLDGLQGIIRDYGDLLCRYDWAGIPETECHGDLTFENVLYDKNGKFVLIDMDVPDISSWYMDVGKIFQDVMGHWCLRRLALEEPGTLAFLNAQVALNRTGGYMVSMLREIDPNILNKLPQLAALNLLRALPYCGDEKVAVFILSRLNSMFS